MWDAVAALRVVGVPEHTELRLHLIPAQVFVR